MKNLSLSLRKRATILLTVLLLVITNSCKKENQFSDVNNNNEIITANGNISGSQKIQPKEMLDWYNALPFGYKLFTDWGKATQAIYNGQQVIQVPISANSAYFFTKVNGVLNVSIYKWLDQDIGSKTYTGRIAVFSYQDYSFKAYLYNKGKLIKAGIFNNYSNYANKNLQMNTTTDKLKVQISSPQNFILDLLCWLSGGRVIDGAIDGCIADGGGIWSSIAEFFTNLFGGGDSSNSEAGASAMNWGSYGGSEYSGGYYDGQTGASVSTVTSGGGAWVTINSPCNTGTTEGHGADPNGGGDSCDGNITNTQWVPIVMPVTNADEPSSITDTDPDDASWWNDATTTYVLQTLPTYANLYANYPKVTHNGVTQDMPPAQVYNLIGGGVLNLYNSNPIANGNACAARVSRALLYSGIQIPYIPNKTFQGSDGKYYFVAASALFDWMTKTFGSTGSNVITVTQTQGGANGANFQSFLSGHKGIYILKPVSRSTTNGFGASGHATVYNGNNCMITSEGHPGEYFNARGGVEMIRLWVLN